jgi:hypothetical protein
MAGATRETAIRMAYTALLGLALTIFTVGAAWDIQWHPAVGRDRPQTPPHQMLLGGSMGSGLLSLALILLDTWRARRGAPIDDSNSTRLMFFRAPIGAIVAGFGALLGAIAFPLDDYWHTLYGIDVTLWAPFHVMIITSMVMAGVGGLFLFAAELPQVASGTGKMVAQAGFAALLALTFGALLLLLPQADTPDGLAAIGSYQFVLYPILLALALPLALVSATWVTRRPGTATVVALVFLALRQIMFVFVPQAMDWLVAAEGLTYRPNAPTVIITPMAYPAAILGAALVTDAAYWIARRRGGDGLPALLGAAAVTAVLSGFWDRPWIDYISRSFPGLDVNAAHLAALPFAIVAALAGAGAAALLGRGLAAAKH